MKFRFTYSRHLTCLLALLFLGACASGTAEAPVSDPVIQSDQGPESLAARQRILFFGDSITAGYGLGTAEAFPALIQERIDELGWPFEAVNAGVSGETSAGGLRRIDWVLREPVDVLVLELGANDGLRGVPVVGMRSNLTRIVENTRAKNPNVSVIIAGMRMPPNLGRQYATDFGNAFPEVAEELDAELIPFLLEDVAGHPLLNQFDGIHPTARGHKIVAETVWETLEPILRDRLENTSN